MLCVHYKVHTLASPLQSSSLVKNQLEIRFKQKHTAHRTRYQVTERIQNSLASPVM